MTETGILFFLKVKDKLKTWRFLHFIVVCLFVAVPMFPRIKAISLIASSHIFFNLQRREILCIRYNNLMNVGLSVFQHKNPYLGGGFGHTDANFHPLQSHVASQLPCLA
jgi:hypothetical protein